MPASLPASPPGQRPAKTCRICGAVLAPLRAMRRDLCERPACLAHEAQAQAAEERHVHTQALREQAARLEPSLQPADLPVFWIFPYVADDVPLPEALRAQFEAYLDEQAERADGTAAAEPEPAAAPPALGETQMCTRCQGWCCARSAPGRHAFLDASHLRRWQLQHPGSTPADAARAYKDLLPARHSEGSCAYHGAQGCVLPRTMRASLCNTYVCGVIDELRDAEAARPGRPFVIAKGRHAPDSAVLAGPEGMRPLLAAHAGPDDDRGTGREEAPDAARDEALGAHVAAWDPAGREGSADA